MAKDAWSASTKSTSASRLASKTAHASATRAKAIRAASADPAAISTLCCAFARTSFLNATATTCIALFPQAALGAEITLTTLDGEVKLKIPEGTQSGQDFRIRGKGVPHLNEYGRGDLVAQIIVRTPTKLNKAQKELLRELGQTVTVENTPTARSLLEKVKEMFS